MSFAAYLFSTIVGAVFGGLVWFIVKADLEGDDDDDLPPGAPA